MPFFFRTTQLKSGWKYSVAFAFTCRRHTIWLALKDFLFALSILLLLLRSSYLFAPTNPKLKFQAINSFKEAIPCSFEETAKVYHRLFDYDESYDSHQSLFELADSTEKTVVNDEIVYLKSTLYNEQKDSIIQQNQVVLAAAKQEPKRSLLFVYFLFIVVSVVLLIVWKRSKENRRSLEQSEASLKNTRKLLLDKNTYIVELEEKLATINTSDQEAKPRLVLDDFFNQNILTDTDWSSFKANFEKAYPYFIANLRTQYPDMTEAEERLFLFIRLNLNTKEIANILGISLYGVKKTRYRLRKRLNLEEEASLEDYVQKFPE